MHRLFLFAASLLVAGTALAGPPSKAKDPAPPGPVSGSAAVLAGNCFNCHGTDGRTAAAIPPLAGLERDYIVQGMKAFRDGSREATIMHQLAKGYTDEEIVALAEHFAKLKP